MGIKYHIVLIRILSFYFGFYVTLDDVFSKRFIKISHEFDEK